MNLTNKGMIAGKGCAGDDNRYAVDLGVSVIDEEKLLAVLED